MTSTPRVSRLALLILAATAAGCTTMRIVRYRDLSPDRPARVFTQGVARHADAPFLFTQPATHRTDLDTLSVRDVDGTMKPFAQYMESRRIRGFLVIRNDTILYEHYTPPLTDTTLWTAYSVTKSVTSLLLGIALQNGAIHSLDDSITRYVPEARGRPALEGVTLRHLLGMQSGFAFTKTNGSPWHDLRSNDAHFYYTGDRTGTLLDVKREDPPGTRWAYKEYDPGLLALALTRATGKSLAQQLEDGVWRKIGTERNASFNLDHPGGLENASAGLNAVARDYARVGRLMLDYGRWNGSVVIDSAWVAFTTQLDTSRHEPEVVTWYRMQHQGYWWIPMHNWANERDFYADGSRGQRVYVHRPTNTIIVQLAEVSDQDFPFRRIVHYLNNDSYVYPVGIGGLTLRAARIAPDSGSATLTRLLAAEERDPARYTVNEAGILAVVETLRGEGHADAANAVLRAGGRRYASSCAYQAAARRAGVTIRSQGLVLNCARSVK